MMNCHDVREHLSAPSRGGTGLTERALVHAHVERCADCQAARASLQLAVIAAPPIEPSRAAAVSAAVASLSERARFTIACGAPALVSLRSSLLSAYRWTGRAASEAAGAIAAAGSQVTRMVGQLPGLFMPPARAAAGLIGRAGSASARVAPRLIWLGSALMVSGQGSVHAASRATGSGATRLLGFLSRLGGLVTISSRACAGAADVAIVACRARATRFLAMLVQIGGQAGARLSSTLAPAARAAGRAVVMIPARIGAYPRASVGLASLAVLVVAILFLGPRQWPDNLVPRFSSPERVSREVAEPAVVEPVAQAAPPRPVSIPQPVPAARVAAPETHATIPPPVRRSIVSAPQPPAEASRNADASDPAAAIDWLLKGSGRRQVESP